ncbi:MAG: DUF642 domain-containing protein [Actinobacteria bacterium]|nr:DUF642 domain-containing protein [Actinomycetota bacterium]
MTALVATVHLAAPAAANTFSDGDFEAPVETKAYETYYNLQKLGPWTVTAVGGAALGGIDHGTGPGGTPCRTAGAQCVDLNGRAPGAIEQVFDTVAGDTCSVEFWMSQHGQLQTRGASLNAQIDNNAPVPFSHSGPGWSTQSFTFTVTAAATKLTFASTVLTGGAGPQIDDVSVTCTPSAPAATCTSPATMDGTPDNDVILLYNGADNVILGHDGNDVVVSMGTGNDVLCGGSGDDVLVGGDGSDSLFGEPDGDVLVGGSGVDNLDGGPGINVCDLDPSDTRVNC